MTNSHFLWRLAAAVLLLGVFGTRTATAANHTWVGNTDIYWGTAADWSGNAVPAAGDSLFFGPAGASGLSLSNNLTAGVSFAGITFNSGGGAFTLYGNSIGLTSGITNDTAGLETISNALVLNASVPLNDSGGGTTLAGAISGSGALTNAGSGPVVLGDNNNSFTGGVTINGGTFQVIGASGNSGLGKGNTTVNAGGTLIGAVSDSFGYEPHNAPPGIFINGGTVTELSGSGYRITLPNVTFMGGTLTSPNPGNTGNYSLFGNGSTCTITTVATNATAVINATGLAVQEPTVFNIAAGNVTGGPTPGYDLLISAILEKLTSAAQPLAKIGAGTLALSGANTTTATFTVGSGVLALTGSAAFPSSLVIVSNGATLDVSGMSNPPFTMASGKTLVGAGAVNGSFATFGTLDAGQYSTSSSALVGAGTLVFSNDLTLDGANTIKFYMSGTPGGLNSLIKVRGNLTVDNNNTIALVGASSYANGTYPLFTYGSETNGISQGWALTGFVPGALQAASIVDNGAGQISMIVSNLPSSLTWAGDNLTNNWDTTSSNWLDGAAVTVFANGDPVTFNNSGSTNPAVNLVGTVEPGALLVTNTDGYTFAGPGAISGATGLVKQGSGSLVLTETGGDNFTGGINVSGGLLVLADGGPAISGGLTISSGSVLLDEGGTISGDASISAGASLQVGNNDDLGTTLPDGTVTMNGSLDFAGTGYTTVGNVISGGTNGLLSVDNGNYVNLTAVNTFAGNILVTNGTLYFNKAGAANGSSGSLGNSSGGGRTVVVNTNSTLNGAINNWFGGTGLADTNFPAIIVNGGTMNSTRYTAIGSITLENGATLTESSSDPASYQGYQFRGGITVGGLSASTITSGNSAADDLGSNTVFNVAATGESPDLTVATGLRNQSADYGSGAGGLIKTGAGTMLIAAACTYTGPTIVSNGVLQLNDAGSISDSTSIVLLPGSTIDVSPRSDTDDALTLGSGQTLSGSGTVLGNLVVDPGATVAPGAGNSLGVLDVTNAVTLSGTATMKLNAAGETSDLITGVASMVYGGTLTVTNVSGTLSSGQTFQLFNAAGYSGSFAATNLPALGAGLAWNTANLAVNGTLSIMTVVKPVPLITSVSLSGMTLTLTATNGAPGGPFILLATTNLTLPLADWTPVLTNAFDGNGNLDLSTNIVNSNAPVQFYILSQ